MVIINSVNLFGSHTSLEMETESHLAATIAEPADAIAATYRAFERWERAYLADIDGERSAALEQFEAALETTREARDKWKRAERAQTDLIAHMMRYPDDFVVRPEVREEFARLSAADHVRELQLDGRFLDVPLEGSDSMLEFAASLLPIEDERDAGSLTEGDAAWDELMRLFRLDQRMIMRIKVALKEFERTLVESRDDVAAGQLFEANQYETHRGTGIYPVSEEAARVRTHLTAYMTFKEAYGTFVKKAVTVAGDDLAEEVPAFVGEDDPAPATEEGVTIEAESGASLPADD